MKILFLGAAGSNHTIRWVNKLSERGHEVLLVCRDDQRESPGNIRILNQVKVHYLKYGGGMGYYLNSIEFKSIIKYFSPDIVNAHYATGYGALARISKAKPLIISFWGSDIFDYPFKSKINKKLLQKNIEYADAIAATSNAMAKKIKEVYPNLNKNIVVTPFGVDTNIFKPDNRQKNQRPIIGIVKYLKPIYDIPLLINAFAIVKHTTDFNPELRIYGGGPQLSELQNLCRKLNIENDVIFYGTIPNTEIPSAINQMDVFVNCSLTESFGVALVEAMACEVPVIATATDGFKEVVENKKTGIILQDRNPKTMADAIVQLLSNKKLSKEYGINGRNRVLKLYDWESNVSKMESLYEKTSKCKK